MASTLRLKNPNSIDSFDEQRVINSAKFMTRILEDFETRGLRTMLEKGVNDKTLRSAFTFACRNNNPRIANIISSKYPDKYYYRLNRQGDINLYKISI